MNEHKTPRDRPEPQEETETRLNGAAAGEAGEVQAADGGTPDDAPGQTTAEASTQNEEADLIQQLEEERARAAEYLDQAQRARAEFLNYRRRVEQEMQQVRANAGERLIARLLPVMDDFHRAIEAVPESERDNAWLQGMLLIERKLWNILESEGVRPIEAVGQPFDPSLHEAVAIQEGAPSVDTVVQEFQRGYMLNDRVLRPATVMVGQRNDGTATGRARD